MDVMIEWRVVKVRELIIAKEQENKGKLLKNENIICNQKEL